MLPLLHQPAENSALLSATGCLMVVAHIILVEVSSKTKPTPCGVSTPQITLGVSV